MKTNLLKSALLAVSLLSAVSSASAETLHARIPFGFSADGRAMPAGSYAIRPIANSAAPALLFENEDTKAQIIVLARPASSSPLKSEGPLTFVGGEHMELTNLAASGWAYEISARSVRTSLKGVALTLTSGGK